MPDPAPGSPAPDHPDPGSPAPGPRRQGVARAARVAWALARASLMGAMQYRSNFLVSLLIGACNAAGVAAPMWFVYQHVPEVAGWSLPASLAVSAFFLLMAGIVETFIEPNLGAVVEGVRSGALDYVLIRPADGQLLVSAARVDPAKIWSIAAGLALLAWVLPDLRPDPLQIAAAAAMFAAGIAAIYSLYLSIICLSFWFVRVDNLRFLLSSVSDAGRWPVDVYRGAARLLLTVIVPVAIVTSWPALALTGRLTIAGAAQGLAVGAGALIASRWLWGRAIRAYSSASS